jgi:plastocyanin
MRRVSIIAAVSVVLAASVWAAAAVPPDLKIHEHKFLPPTLTVAPGTTVKWVNEDEDTHTVTSTTGVFTSPALEHTGTFAYTFAQPGTYTYICALHPLMRATVTVK